MAGPGGDGDLRHLLKLHRTEIAMAVDDVFPLLHGLADHDVVPEHVFKETLSQTEREGSHRAFHALLTWLLGRDVTAVRDFWAVLFKDYNLERYTRLRPLHSAFPKEVDLGRQRRSRRLSPSPMAPVPHRPQGKRKAPEERDGARMAQPLQGAAVGQCLHLSPQGLQMRPSEPPLPSGLQAAATSVHRVVAVAASEVPVTRGAAEGKHVLIRHGLEPSSAKAGSRAGDELYDPAAGEEPGARSRSRQAPREDASRRQWVTASPGATQGGSGSDPLPAPPWQENEDECAACGDGGELICCDGCPRAFHLACLVPPLPRVPSGSWQCGSCAVKPGQLREADEVAEQPPAIPGEEERVAHMGRGNGSVCSRCFTRIPTPQHCPAEPNHGELNAWGNPTSGPQLMGSMQVRSDLLPWAVPQGAWDGILQWAFQSMARPLADTHGLFV
uniref:Autoimmune regulator n=1 Tax=Anser cygnoides TaxID=8845 RepID=A0A8B9DLJ3_ANSCY